MLCMIRSVSVLFLRIFYNSIFCSLIYAFNLTACICELFCHREATFFTYSFTAILVYLMKCYAVAQVGRDSSVGMETVRVSNPRGREIFRTRSNRPWGPPSYLDKRYCVGFLAVNRPGRGVKHPPHLAPRLQKEWKYASAPPLDLHGLF